MKFYTFLVVCDDKDIVEFDCKSIFATEGFCRDAGTFPVNVICFKGNEKEILEKIKLNSEIVMKRHQETNKMLAAFKEE